MTATDHTMTALIMAGGTGGHIFPGLSVAYALQQKNWHACWLGSKGGMEEHLVVQHGIEINLINVSGLRGNGIVGWFKAPIRLTKAVMEALKVVRKTKPDVILGFGGFASGPGGVAAMITRTPLVIHEQNATAGLTNRILAKIAKKVFQAFPGAFEPAAKVETVGNPLRNAIEALNSKTPNIVRSKDRVNILVIGGSRGALALNKYLPDIFSTLKKECLIHVRHQVGQGRLQQTQEYYAQACLSISENFLISEFIDDMAEAFDWADLVICRAGASTVSEIAAAGKCAIFIPYPYAVDDHQTANASWLAREKAAICVSEEKLTSPDLIRQLSELIHSPKARERIAEKARGMAYLHAAEKVADYCDRIRNQAA